MISRDERRAIIGALDVTALRCLADEFADLHPAEVDDWVAWHMGHEAWVARLVAAAPSTTRVDALAELVEGGAGGIKWAGPPTA